MSDSQVDETGNSIDPGDRKNPRKRIVLAGIFLIILVSIGIYFLNYSGLQSPMNEVLSSDPRNQGIKVSVHYDNYVDQSVIVYDMTDVAGTNSEADVFRVLLQFADKMQNASVKRVKLACRGKVKFWIAGDYFQKLGKEFGTQNPIYTTRTFPENTFKPDGSPGFSHWEGGFLGVTSNQLQDFNDFHAQWWLNDLSKT